MALPPEDTAEMYDRACAVLQADCSELPEPYVHYAPLLWQGGVLGTFLSSNPDTVWLDVMFLDQSVADWYHAGTVLHEMIHYVDWHITEDKLYFDVCESEAKAWRAENSYFVEMGHHEWAHWNWREGYPHCLIGIEQDDTD